MRAVAVAIVAIVSAGCAIHPVQAQFVAGMISRSSLIRIVCPDQLPPFILQDETCPHACGYSCLPERWHSPERR